MSAVAPLRNDAPAKIRPSDLRRTPLERRSAADPRAGKSGEPQDRPRPHLEVVQHRGRTVSIVAVCCLMLFGLLLGAVAFQTQLAQNQLALDKVEREVTSARSRYDVLRRARAELRSPNRLSVEAAALGMLPAKSGEFMTIDPSVIAAVTAAASGLPNDVSDQKTSNFDQFGTVKAVTAATP